MPSISARKKQQGLLPSNKRPACFNCIENDKGTCLVGGFLVGECYSGWCPSWSPNGAWIDEHPIAFGKLP